VPHLTDAPQPAALTPIPGGPPKNPEAAQLLETARLLLRERELNKALVLLEKAGSIEPDHPGLAKILNQTRIEHRRADIESLTSAALNHFGQNDYGKSKKAVDQALKLDPENKKAKELSKILGALS
jgi:tetratricopeptide (TPR) repeat protein